MKRVAWQRIISGAVLWISFAACAAQTESKAIHQANIEARADGYDLRRYTADARYNLSGHGRWTVFYEVSAGSLPLYVDLGLTLLKLGEQAVIPLSDFSLEGGQRRHLRRTHRPP